MISPQHQLLRSVAMNWKQPTKTLFVLLIILCMHAIGSYGKTKPSTTKNQKPFITSNSVKYDKVGKASWYGAELHGRRTSTGKVYSMHEMTAASLALPVGTYAQVTNLSNNKTVVVKITDRGPFSGKRIIDLSYAAAKKLGFINKGVTHVRVQTIPVPRISP